MPTLYARKRGTLHMHAACLWPPKPEISDACASTARCPRPCGTYLALNWTECSSCNRPLRYWVGAPAPQCILWQ